MTKPYIPTPYAGMILAGTPLNRGRRKSSGTSGPQERPTNQIMVPVKKARPKPKVTPESMGLIEALAEGPKPKTPPPEGSTTKTSHRGSTSDTQVRQALQDSMNTIMRWNRLRETSVQYRSSEQWLNLTKFFKKSFYEVWVNGLGQPMMLPEDAVAIMVATASLLFAEIDPEKVRAMEIAIKHGREG